MIRLTLFFCTTACLLPAQLQPHFGLVAGVPATDTLISSQSASLSGASSSSNSYNSATKRLQIGPAFRLDLIAGFGLEFDAIYQRVDYDATAKSTQAGTPPFSSSSFEQTTGNRWQFPLLAQYSHRIPLSKSRVFVEFGPSISHIGGGRTTVNQTTNAPTSPTTTSVTTNVSSFTGPGTTQAGITAGGGIDVTMFHLHLRPQFRYSHWFLSSQSGIPTQVVLQGVSALLVPAPVVSIASNFRTQANEASFVLEAVF